MGMQNRRASESCVVRTSYSFFGRGNSLTGAELYYQSSEKFFCWAVNCGPLCCCMLTNELIRYHDW